MSGFKTVIYRFWTEYVPDPNDPAKLVGIDKVEFGPPGMQDRQRGVEKVSRILSARPRDPGAMNEGLKEANDFADFIRVPYEAWKKGQEIPETGTPLAAWNAITPELAEIFKARSIKTVEEIAELTDAGISRVPLPGIRKMIEAAKLFLAAKDQTRVAGDIARQNERIFSLETQLAEALEALKANDRTGQLEPLTRKRRGRPPKAEQTEAAA